MSPRWQTSIMCAAAQRLGIDGLTSLLRLVEAGTINGPTAKELLAELYVSGGNPEALVRERGLAQVSDTAELSALVDAAIAPTGRGGRLPRR